MTDRLKLTRTWNSMVANLKLLECNLLRLMRHPDAKLDEVAAAKAAYTDAYTRLVDMQPKVEDALGGTRYLLNHISLTDHARRT